MSDVTRIGLGFTIAGLGIVTVIGSFSKGPFFFTHPGASKPGPEMPKWFARPFFFLIGLFALWAAYMIFTGHSS